MRTTIAVHGARENNLQNIDVELPRDQLIVVKGMSGSGKSPLGADMRSRGYGGLRVEGASAGGCAGWEVDAGRDHRLAAVVDWIMVRKGVGTQGLAALGQGLVGGARSMCCASLANGPKQALAALY